jgi:hypothetical protein
MVASSEVGAEDREKEAFADFAKMVESATEPLFKDGELDTELEQLKADIASVSTSTAFIDAQKAREKEVAHLLATGQPLPEGMTAQINILDFQVPESAEGLPEAATDAEAIVEATMAMADAPMAAETSHAQPEDAQITITEETMADVTTIDISAEETAIEMSPEPIVEAPLEAVAETGTDVMAESETAPEAMAAATTTEHTPSPELEQQAEEARWERHASVIADAIAESQKDQALNEEPVEAPKKLESEPENTV